MLLFHLRHNLSALYYVRCHEQLYCRNVLSSLVWKVVVEVVEGLRCIWHITLNQHFGLFASKGYLFIMKQGLIMIYPFALFSTTLLKHLTVAYVEEGNLFESCFLLCTFFFVCNFAIQKINAWVRRRSSSQEGFLSL